MQFRRRLKLFIPVDKWCTIMNRIICPNIWFDRIFPSPEALVEISKF